jgi:hypothetical protein
MRSKNRYSTCIEHRLHIGAVMMLIRLMIYCSPQRQNDYFQEASCEHAADSHKRGIWRESDAAWGMFVNILLTS